ncbi:MAG: tyrosine-type recombinase/integrase [Methanobacterium paludis]|nr:tyrosine-type recombinase/integrase [Methanobacterium paludis]
MDQNDEILFETWFLKRDLAPSTQKLYRKAINFYLKVTGMRLSELKEEAKHEEQNGIWIDDRKIQLYMLRFKKYLEQSNRSPNTQNTYFNAVKSFYGSQGIQVPEIKMPKGDICLEENYHKLLTREDIRKMIEASNTRDSSIIYVMALSGMSQAEMRNLTIQKLINSINDVNPEIETLEDLFKYEKDIKDTIITLHITRKKENYRYITFLPPESLYSIIAYLRERCFGKNKHIRITDYDSPIFVTNNGKNMNEKTVAGVFRTIGQKSGFKAKNGAWAYWRSHALRKYFISTIIKNTGDHMLANYMAGHKIDSVTRAYWIMDPEDLKKKYMEVLNYLSIDEVKSKDIKSKEYKTLMEDSKKKDEKIQELKEEHNASMIHAMNELNETKKSIGEMQEKNYVFNELMLNAISGKGLSAEDRKRVKSLKNNLVDEVIKHQQHSDEK